MPSKSETDPKTASDLAQIFAEIEAKRKLPKDDPARDTKELELSYRLLAIDDLRARSAAGEKLGLFALREITEKLAEKD